jgi:hypothetical protein
MSARSVVSTVTQVSINELRKAIPIYGKEITVIVQSEPGCGKSSLLAMLAEDNGDAWRSPKDDGTDKVRDDKYDYVYVDAPCKDVMDLGSYIPVHGTKKLEFYFSSLFKLDSPKPKVIMLDEVMKAPKMLQVMFTRLMLERMVSDKPLPDGSMLFATSNNQRDGLGDGMLAHAGNRVMIVSMKKPNNKEWNLWASENNISRVIRTWVAMNPNCLASYLDGGQENNPYIFNPDKPALSFCSPRSLAKCDVTVRNADKLGNNMTKAGLAGTIGESAANMMASFIMLEKEIVSTMDVISDPMGVAMPEKPAALFMMMFSAVDDIETQDDLTAFMKFIKRAKHEELQSIFFTLLYNNKRTVSIAKNNAEVKKWAADNLELL